MLLSSLFIIDNAKNIIKLCDERGLMKKQVTKDLRVYPSNYSKKEIKLEVKTITEKVQLILLPNEVVKNPVSGIINAWLTKNKFQIFYDQKIAFK